MQNGQICLSCYLDLIERQDAIVIPRIRSSVTGNFTVHALTPEQLPHDSRRMLLLCFLFFSFLVFPLALLIECTLPNLNEKQSSSSHLIQTHGTQFLSPSSDLRQLLITTVFTP